jgi:hypothetical protein
MNIFRIVFISLPSIFFLQTTVEAQASPQGNRTLNAQCSIEVEREGRFKFPCHAEFDQDGSVSFNDLQMSIRCKDGKPNCAGFEEEVVREGHFGSIEVYGESVRLCWNRGVSRSAQGCIEGLRKVGNCAVRGVEPCFSKNKRDCVQSVNACVVPVSSQSLQDTFNREESARQLALESLAQINERWRKSITTYRCSRNQSRSAIDFEKRFGTHPDDPGFIHFYKDQFMSRSSNNRFPRSTDTGSKEPMESAVPSMDGGDGAWRRVQRNGETLFWVWRTVEFVGGSSEQNRMEFNLREKRLFFREDWNQNFRSPKILALQCQEVQTR